jgi:hypothetical protein
VRRWQGEERAELLVEWKKQQEARKADIATRRAQWEEEKEQWALEKAAAKTSGKRFSKKKPTLGKLPAVILRPPVVAMNNDSSDDDDDPRSDTNNE